MPFLKVLFPDRTLKKFKIKHGMTIGRGRKNLLQVDDSSISRQHIQLLIQTNSQVVALDLGSSNGIKINGKRVSQKILNHKDIIVIGATHLLYLEKTQGEIIDLNDPDLVDRTGTQLISEESLNPPQPDLSTLLETEWEEENKEDLGKTNAFLKTERLPLKKENEKDWDIDALLASENPELIDLFLDED
ncbi:MAG: FHA domain-containing protein [Planctomycetota bacterium]